MIRTLKELAIIYLILLTIIYLLSLFIRSRYYLTGVEVERITAEQNQLQEENNEINIQNLNNSSLQTIEKKAIKLGFKEAETLYLK